ncbi:MAG: hypothetical protein HY619_01940 [Thaumarchaeota archaeon]|nr:hypothetical protein [Nitrososphaerota archaeon]
MLAQDLVNGLAEAGINVVVTVPDSKFLIPLEMIRSDQRFTSVISTNEGEGVAICAGSWMAGKKPAMIMESTGLFLASNAIERLGCIHGIPMLLLVSHRGDSGDRY